MHPILFRLGDSEVPSYGVALAAAFAVGIALARRRARASGLDEAPLVDACVIALLASLLGARLLWLATHPEAVAAAGGSWLAALRPASGRLAGLSMLGGVVLASAASLGYLAWRRMPLLASADLLAPLVLLGEGITRIGCFLNGCCHGRPCSGWWCLSFPAGGDGGAAIAGAVHPTQLYASALGLAGFAALSALGRARPAAGTVFCAFLIWLGTQRLALDGLRVHDPGTLWLALGGVGVPSSSVLAAGLVTLGLAGLAAVARRRRPGRGPGASGPAG